MTAPTRPRPANASCHLMFEQKLGSLHYLAKPGDP